MKTVSMPRLAITCVLGLGAMVVWAAAAPTTTGGDLEIGGVWDPYTGCHHCKWIELDDCSQGTQFTCKPEELWILKFGRKTDPTGEPDITKPKCRDLPADPPCQDMYDSACPTGCIACD